MDARTQQLASVLVERHGLQYAFGITGSGGSLQLIAELERLGAAYFPVSHEACGALMAGAVVKSTGRLSASISIKGPGLANMLSGVASNYVENIPSLSIAEAYGASVPPSRRHKRLDHQSLMAPVSKAVLALDDLDVFDGWIDTARAEVPGPVHLDLCERQRRAAPRPRIVERGATAWHEIQGRINEARRPAVIVGSLACRRAWAQQLAQLTVPVFTTVAAKGVVDETLAHAAGIFTGAGKELAPETIVLTDADLVVGLGLRNAEVLDARPFTAPLVIVDEVRGFDDGFAPEATVVGDDAPGGVLDALLSKAWGEDVVATALGRLAGTLSQQAGLPARYFGILDRLEFDHALVLDTGSFCTIGEHVWRAGRCRSFYGSNNGRNMGIGLPTAVGVALCRRDQPVFCVVGDGGMRMYPAEITLAVREKLPVCFVLMTDGRYGSIVSASVPAASADRATTLPGTSWFASVEAMGCATRRVESETAFEDAVRSWSRAEPLFVEAPFDRDRYRRMVDGLR